MIGISVSRHQARPARASPTQRLERLSTPHEGTTAPRQHPLIPPVFVFFRAWTAF